MVFHILNNNSVLCMSFVRMKRFLLLFIYALTLVGMLVFYTEWICERSIESLVPVLAYADNDEEFVTLWAQERLEKLYPILFSEMPERIIAQREDWFLLKKIKPVELLTMMGLENGNDMAEDTVRKDENEEDVEKIEVLEEIIYPEETPQPMKEPQEAVETAFVPHTLQNKVDMQVLADYESLLKSFYTIDACAMVGSNLLDASQLSAMDLRITKDTQEPQILIYHTHSQEGFADSVPGDDSTTIVGVGEHLAQILREEYGYQVIHHLGKYDAETRNNAYSRALPDIVQVLEENPSIEVVIDLHRDAVNEDYKLVTDLDGRPTARFMFFNGVSCTKNTGSISYLENPYQQENLAFSFQMKKAAEEYYPGLTRKNYIHGYRYNMHLVPRTTLIELGAQNNTVEEAMNACYPIAHILDMVLTGA